eukprot:CAMPEP_0119316306 /NCGR_PEP_ID=MMETSP1333-20130426/39384_1 /TAXON_ID=418940 /ORGANISM="Scyphosphaera apsteinii, Strain RCC1455" /LENGTH=235 /DNA_ID=CAMNT_0007321921 /DNA_START=116 /DNA_END=823 /DNA_ORIENTATION=+
MSQSEKPHLNQDEVTRAAMIQEATVRVRDNTTGNGKFFLSTGAWFLTDEYVSSAAKRGCPECVYRLDERLSRCLARLFSGSSVTELGAGIGRYKHAIKATGLVHQYEAYDGMPDVEDKSKGVVHHADLSTEDNIIARSEWCMTLEVAEHIPKQFEGAFLRNIDKSNTRGLVISWSPWGKGQSAHGHVNPKQPRQLIELFTSRGYATDMNATSTLRRCATFPYFKKLHVFRRKDMV